MRFAARLAIVMLVALGLLMPRVSAAVASATGAPFALLCDGGGLVAVGFDSRGQPSGRLDSAPCPLVHLAATAPEPLLPRWLPAPLAVPPPAPEAQELPPAPPTPHAARAPPGR